MSNSEPKMVSLWVVLAQAAGVLLFFWGACTAYSYFKPGEVSTPPDGQYAETIQWMSVKDGEEEFKKGKKCILYDFTASWCHFCKSMDAEVFEIKPVAQFINQYFIPITVMDRTKEDGKNPDRVKELQSQYGVRGFPTLVVRYPNDQSKKLVGYRNEDYVVSFLHQAVNLK